MNILELMLIPLFAVAMLILPVVYVLRKKNKNSAAKKAFVVNLCSFFAVLALAVILPVRKVMKSAATMKNPMQMMKAARQMQQLQQMRRR